MMETTYDVIVIGAGIVGSSTAYHLAKDGATVLLLDQFPLPHARGSSHGHSRLLRRAYPTGHEVYTKMTSRARDMWRTLEKESGLKIYKEVGVLSIAFDPKIMEGTQKTMTSQGVPYRKLTSAQLRTEFPMLRAPPEAAAMVENEGGMLCADKAGEAFRKVFVANGGVVRDNQKVTMVTPGDVIRVQTQDAVYHGRRVVLTAGPWANHLLKPLGLNLPIQPWSVSVMYWKEKTPGMFGADRFPCLRYIKQIEHEGKHNIYCVPSGEYPGMFKLCLHQGYRCDPDERDSVSRDIDVRLLSKFVSKWMPELESTPSIIEKCFYTMTPDEGYILDVHPRWDNIIVGAGFSGHGFKTAPVSGRILADLALEKSPGYDMKQFSITKFTQQPAVKAKM